MEYQKEGNVKCSKVYYSKEDVENHFDGTFPEVVHSIGEAAFKDNEIKSLTLPTFITSFLYSQVISTPPAVAVV